MFDIRVSLLESHVAGHHDFTKLQLLLTILKKHALTNNPKMHLASQIQTKKKDIYKG